MSQQNSTVNLYGVEVRQYSVEFYTYKVKTRHVKKFDRYTEYFHAKENACGYNPFTWKIKIDRGYCKYEFFTTNKIFKPYDLIFINRKQAKKAFKHELNNLKIRRGCD